MSSHSRRGAPALALFGTVLAYLVFAPQVAIPATVTVGAIKDNTLYQPANSGTTNSNGAGEHLFAGDTDDGYLRRGLIAFNITNVIPSGSTITAVTLTLYLSRTKDASEPVSLHRLLANWGEGTSNAAQEEGRGIQATSGDATWYHRFYPASFWSTSAAIFARAPARASRSDGRATIHGLPRDWRPTFNFGWIIPRQISAGSSKAAKPRRKPQNVSIPGKSQQPVNVHLCGSTLFRQCP